MGHHLESRDPAFPINIIQMIDEVIGLPAASFISFILLVAALGM
jgi:hypothetical protein